MQTVDQIRDAADTILRHILTQYVGSNPFADSLAIACECDPGASSLSVHIARENDDLYGDPMTWSSSYVDQKCSPYEKPLWFAEFDKLNSDYFSSSDEDESGYAKIEQYFQNILKGVSVALYSLKPELVGLGYPNDVKLAVVTEDDDNEKTMYERVESFNDP